MFRQPTHNLLRRQGNAGFACPCLLGKGTNSSRWGKSKQLLYLVADIIYFKNKKCHSYSWLKMIVNQVVKVLHRLPHYIWCYIRENSRIQTCYIIILLNIIPNRGNQTHIWNYQPKYQWSLDKPALPKNSSQLRLTRKIVLKSESGWNKIRVCLGSLRRCNRTKPLRNCEIL